MDENNEICRFCLKSTALTESISINNAEFRLRFEAVFNFNITAEELLPSLVCKNCRNRLIEFYNFHETVRINQIELGSKLANDHKQSGIEDVKIKQDPTCDQNNLESVVWLMERQTYDTEDVKQENSETVLEFAVELNDPDTSTDSKKSSKHIDENARIQEERRESESQEERVKRYDDENRKISEFFKMTCEYCSETAETFGRLQTHCRKAHDKRAGVKCCDRTFYVKSRIIEHINSHQNPKRFYCEICQKYYNSKEYLALHRLKKHSKTEDNSFRCDKCGKNFPQQGLLNAHLKAHIQTKCTVCNLTLANNSLKMHMLRHTDMKYICDTCGKEFRSKITLELHVKRHMGIDPVDRLQCHICSRWMLCKRNLQIHMETVHCDKNRQFSCNICPKKYHNERALRVHKSTVHVEKKFECDFCGKKFKRSKHLKEHRASHTGETLYFCDVCGMTFNSNGNLYSHKKNKHPEEWLKAKKKAMEADYAVMPLL
ncbi:transcription factor grauzone-like [Malaya genurostris]|uniref:transcription factor grauzone-like n=1 Tax=Malaya genurostris TaxID=325434 RepID=UPI0026F3C06C|nr:transcription factor grauzone-like [Malaya genurostris]